MLDVVEIIKLLPHRYPFLLVDRITHLEEGKRITGIKNVTINEPFFQGHFPAYPVMPGVLIIEAMAQVGGILAFKTELEEKAGQVVYFLGIDKARFRRPVRPGDEIRLELEVLRRRGDVWQFKGEAYVGKKLVAEAQLLAQMVKEENLRYPEEELGEDS